MKVADFKEHDPYLRMYDHTTCGACGRYEHGWECTRPKGHTGRCEAGVDGEAAASWDYE